MTHGPRSPRLVPILALVAATILPLAGCGGHYRVVDNANGRIFYTRGFSRSCDGTTHFTDVRTCTEVSLISAQVEGITPAEFQRRTAR
mgnify:CR=1 FL=1|jgi:hypothetical protein